MSTVTVEVDIRQIEAAIRRLKTQDKIKLVENLEKETWPDRFKALMERIDRKSAKHPISEQEINRVCQTVRHKRYAHRSH